ncbi:MAG: type I-U CRISPR-associated protein Cas8c [Planctomycetes bacterium]|nr:type I-U CRISPR-associated protein Cas8c [Planctomycetota bacterium]
MIHPDPHMTVNVDLTNPGRFFACCGLLELADRLWPSAEGWFDTVNDCFSLFIAGMPEKQASRRFIEALSNAEIRNAMTAAQVQRREELASIPKKERTAQGLEHEKKALDKLWRESAILISGPFAMRIDWFLDEHSGGSTFKTWAGQQSVIDIAGAMKSQIESEGFASVPPEQWLSKRSNGEGLPFNFDAVLGGQGSDLDVGFSRDPLQISTTTCPLTELLAFVGLQRFRPAVHKERNRYRYSAWTKPLCSELAGPSSCGSVAAGEPRHFEFRLLYRTKYLKSFLPAMPIGVSS